MNNGNPYSNGASGRGSGYRGYETSDARYMYRNPSNKQPGQRTPFVNSPTDITNMPLLDTDYDPFNAGIPVDRKSGFVDMTDKAFGADTNPSQDSITYGNRQVSTKGADEAPTADFGFTPTPRTHAIRPQRKNNDPSFLVNDKGQKDFYSLEDSVYPGDSVAESSTISGQAPDPGYYTDDDLPYEVSGEDELPYEDNTESGIYDDVPARRIRPSVMPGASDSIFVAPASEVPHEIPINADIDKTGYEGGRIVETAPDNGTASSAIYEVPQPVRKEIGRYIPPSREFLAKPVQTKEERKEQLAKLNARARELEETLSSFGIPAKVINITHGPAITRFELTIEKGIKVSRVLSLQDDIALAMAAVSVRIEAPIPGKSAIGIEIPNSKVSAVQLRGLLETKEFKEAKPLEVPLGRDIPNRPIMCDIAKMPHLLIAGSTGSGKSVCINTILTSILYHASPDEVKMILIDPKVVELSVYNGIPHLYMPVVTDPKKAANALKWAVIEMEKRYKLFAENSVRDLAGYNEFLKFNEQKPLPLILIVIDELADLMTVASKEVEVQISRLAAMARAAGLHLIIATQRPSVDVLTGVIKANIPSRIAFAVSAGPDSRTILDSVGAEKLLGKGDMLYAPISAPKPIRGQGAFLTDKEVESVVTYLKNRYGPYYDENIMKLINSGIDDGSSTSSGNGNGEPSDEDELLDDAVNTVIEAGSASVSILQRRLGVGYPRAGKLIDALEKMHVIGPFEGSKPRKVLITKTEWLEIRAKQKR
ncbi:MAG: DNA translocase FtsK [Clostridiales bacterium]|nr:DNA translocase FtsK [Clostridiales bacterium]